MRATGRGLNPQPYLDYLSGKYGELYGLNPPHEEQTT